VLELTINLFDISEKNIFNNKNLTIVFIKCESCKVSKAPQNQVLKRAISWLVNQTFDVFLLAAILFWYHFRGFPTAQHFPTFDMFSSSNST